MKENELRKLVKQSIAGNMDAFAKIYATFSRSVYYIGLRVTKNEYDANDVVQETMIKLYGNLANINNIDSIYYFVRTTAYNCSIDVLRSKKNVFSAEDEVIEGLADTIDDNFVPEKFIETSESRQQVIDIVNDLNAPQRTVILMYYFDDLSVKEIADILEVEEPVVTSRLYRARKSLKNSLSKMNIKGVLSFVMATTVLSKILALDAKASLTNSVNMRNWQNLCNALGSSPEAAKAAIPIVINAVTSPATTGIASKPAAATTGAAAAGKSISIALAAALAVGAIGYGAYYNYDNNSSLQRLSIIEQETDRNSQASALEGSGTIGSPNQYAGTSNVDTEGLGRASGVSNVSPENTIIKVGKLILYYPKGITVSEQQIIQDIGVVSASEVSITTEYYDQIDFNIPSEYLLHINGNNSSGQVLEQVAIIIIVEEITSEGKNESIQ